MFITCLGFKGGVAKTTMAVHLAGALADAAPTRLIDGDANRSALAWSAAGFKVVDERSGAWAARDYEHVVIDSAARPAAEDIKVLADGCDLLVLPTTPDAFQKASLARCLVHDVNALPSNPDHGDGTLVILELLAGGDGDGGRSGGQ
jgi:chromosome partitioning protein